MLIAIYPAGWYENFEARGPEPVISGPSVVHQERKKPSPAPSLDDVCRFENLIEEARDEKPR